MPAINLILGYVTSWIMMTIAVIVLLVISEAAHSFLLVRFTKSGAPGAHPIKLIISSAASPTLLPACAYRPVALIMPVLAIAALFPVCASISLFTFSHLIPGGDVLQILYFMILSEVCAITALYALGTKQAFHSATKLSRESAKLFCALTAAFVSFAVYFTSLGVQGNIFGLDVFSLSLQLKSMRILGHVSSVVFVFLALSYSSYWEELGAGDFFSELPASEYNGPQRAMLLIWTSFKAFLTAMLVTHIFFPWFLFRDADGSQAGTFWLQALGFVLFWLTAIAVRAFGVMFCRKLRTMLEKKMSASGAAFLLLMLAGAAMGILYYESYIMSLVAY